MPGGSDEWKSGKRVGAYVIEDRLGVGGMGEVFRARDTRLRRDVAIKVLPSEFATDRDRLARLEREARLLASLNHPNIAAIYGLEYESEGGAPALVLELVPGDTLAERVARGPLPLESALTCARQIVEALDVAHERGIVHRDLKPANIKVTADGVVKVLDFGLAKAAAADDAPDGTSEAPTLTGDETQQGVVLGTIAYMSPEQARGQNVDKRTDIWAFGCVLYEMLTGRAPFARPTTSDTLAAILEHEPDWSLLPAATPPGISRLLRRTLDKDIRRRLRDIGEAGIELDDAIASLKSGSAKPVADARPVQRRLRSTVIAAISLLVIGLAAYGARRAWTANSGDAEAPIRAVPLTASAGQVRYPTLSPDGDQVAFVWSGPTQDNSDIYVQQIGAGIPLRLTSDPLVDNSPAWSPDGTGVAFLRRQSNSTRHELRVVPPLGGPERKVADVQPRNQYRPPTLAWCPDSTCLIVPDAQGEGKPDALFLIARDSGERRQVTFPPAGVFIDNDPAISPDGLWLVFRRDLTPFTSEMYRVALSANLTPSGEPTRLTDIRLNAGRPAWMPDGREIVFAARGSLWRLKPFTADAPARLPFVGLDGITPAISRLRGDGTIRLVYARVFADTNIWRLDTSEPGLPASSPPRLAVASTRADHLPMLAPDGKRLAFFSGRSGEFELWVADTDGTNAVQLTTLNSLPGFARWSPDGTLLAFHSDPEGHPDVMTIAANGGRPKIATPGPLGGGYPSFSRDGRWIYYSGLNDAGTFSPSKLRTDEATPTPVLVTRAPGGIPIESFDGRDLYYVEVPERMSAVWRQPLAGGPPVKVVDGVLNGLFDVVEGGIYYVSRGSVESGNGLNQFDRQGGDTRLQYLDVATGRITNIARNLGTVALGLSASKDGRTIFFSRVDSSVDELMLVDRFR